MTTCPVRAAKIREMNQKTGISYRLCLTWLANASWDVERAIGLARQDFRRKNPWSVW